VRRCESPGAFAQRRDASAPGRACLPGDLFDGLPPLFPHQPGGLEPEVLDRLGWRLAGFSMKDSAELARAETRGSRNPLHRQWLMENSSSESERILNTIGLRVELQQSGMLQLATRAAVRGSVRRLRSLVASCDKSRSRARRSR
jgi:hypothetical protein